VYSGKRAADLSAELNVVDCGELAKEAQPRIKVAYQRLAHGYLREWRLRRGGIGAVYAIRFGNPRDCGGRDDSCGSRPKLATRPSRDRPFSLIGVRPVDGFAHSPPHKIGEIHSRGSSKAFDRATLHDHRHISLPR
jgi:hypothetical protein